MTNNILAALADNETGLQKFLTSRTGCPHTAADIFQKIAEKLLRKNPSSPIGNQRSYLYKIARNEVIDHYRSENRRNQYEGECALATGELDFCDGERVVIASNKLEILNQILQELPQLTRHIFVLYRIDGMKQKAIAQQLGLNASTVEKRLAKAMKYCRSRMREKGAYGILNSQTSLK